MADCVDVVVSESSADELVDGGGIVDVDCDVRDSTMEAAEVAATVGGCVKESRDSVLITVTVVTVQVPV